MLVVSRPASGSVTPKQTWSSPVTSRGIQRDFCSCVPCTTIGMRAEHVDVDRRCRGHGAAVRCHRMHHDRSLGYAEAGAAIGFRHRDAKPAVSRHRLVKFEWKPRVAVATRPVFVIEALAYRSNAIPDRALFVRKSTHFRSPFALPAGNRRLVKWFDHLAEMGNCDAAVISAASADRHARGVRSTGASASHFFSIFATSTISAQRLVSASAKAASCSGVDGNGVAPIVTR